LGIIFRAGVLSHDWSQMKEAKLKIKIQVMISLLMSLVVGLALQSISPSKAQVQTKASVSKQLLLVTVMPSGDVVCLSCSQTIIFNVQIQPAGQSVSCNIKDNFGRTLAVGGVRNQAKISIRVAPAPQMWLSQYINNGLKRVTLTTTCENTKYSGFTNTILYLNRKY